MLTNIKTSHLEGPKQWRAMGNKLEAWNLSLYLFARQKAFRWSLLTQLADVDNNCCHFPSFALRRRKFFVGRVEIYFLWQASRSTVLFPYDHRFLGCDSVVCNANDSVLPNSSRTRSSSLASIFRSHDFPHEVFFSHRAALQRNFFRSSFSIF